jgi:folate-binding protein YgfZ
MTTLTATAVALRHLGVLAIEGPDVATFLQGQATCDARALSATQGGLGALCNLQGRMIVSFHVLAHEGDLWLVMPRDRVAPVLTHLKKYAVFSKVTLSDASDSLVVLGRAGGGETFTAFADAGTHWLQLSGARQLGIAPAGAGAPAGDGSLAWRDAAIAAGELLVDSANADRFLPQALNYDVIGGVSFRKGCYTGQEVVARMHFKGRMKERLYVGDCQAGACTPGTAVVDADGKAVGAVVDAVCREGQCRIGAVLRHDAVRAGALRLGAADGPALAIGAQPYGFDRGED